MYIFAVALEDGEWHHEKSYTENRKKRKETIDLWNKIETFESDEWNKKYYDVSDPLQKAQGAKVEIILNNNDKKMLAKDEISLEKGDQLVSKINSENQILNLLA